MNILDKINRNKQKEIQLKKSLIPISQLENSVLFKRKTISISSKIKSSKSGIIAEHKRRSPSKEVINQKLSVEEVAKSYEKAGASALSVLTDGRFFGGSLDDLLLARASVNLPILRKDFIVDEYQIIETKAFGADVILLIAASLNRKKVEKFSSLAQSLGLEVLLEVHDLEELKEFMMPSVNLIGVNNRNLKTFEVSLETSKSLAEEIPSEFVKISESGIGSPHLVKELQKFDYQGFLIGETFMKTENPGKSAEEFIKELN